MSERDIQLLLADLALIILLARLLGGLAKRLGQPPVIGEIAAGILLGPTLWHGAITAALFPAALRTALSSLASLGLVLFMFLVGYELDIRLVRGRERVAACVSLASIILPMTLGIGLGAFLGGRIAGIRSRQASALAVLMNTRGLTEIVILSVGLQLGILGRPLYSLMIVMAIATTAMAGPLLKLIYPDRLMRRALAEADRATLGQPPVHRVLVLIGQPSADASLVGLGAALAAGGPHGELVLSHLVPYRNASRLEVGAGLGGELLQLTDIIGQLQALAEAAAKRGIPAVVHSRFSENVAGELPGFVAVAMPDTVVVSSARDFPQVITADGTARTIRVVRDPPAAPSAISVRLDRGPHGAAALHAGAQLARADKLPLFITPGSGRRAMVTASLTGSGVTAIDGTPPPGALSIAAEDHRDTAAHLMVRAGSSVADDGPGQWVPALEVSSIS